MGNPKREEIKAACKAELEELKDRFKRFLSQRGGDIKDVTLAEYIRFGNLIAVSPAGFYVSFQFFKDNRSLCQHLEEFLMEYGPAIYDAEQKGPTAMASLLTALILHLELQTGLSLNGEGDTGVESAQTRPVKRFRPVLCLSHWNVLFRFLPPLFLICCRPTLTGDTRENAIDVPAPGLVNISNNFPGDVGGSCEGQVSAGLTTSEKGLTSRTPSWSCPMRWAGVVLRLRRWSAAARRRSARHTMWLASLHCSAPPLP
jgi:hypothetical protein